MIRHIIAIALLADVQIAAAAQPVGVVTILQGKASVIRGLSEFHVAQGMRLVGDDLVRTEKATFVRIEYEDLTSLEVGPDSRLQVNYPARRRQARPALYVLEGWLKVGSGTDPAAKPALATPGLDVPDMTGVLVIHADGASHALFVEQGTAHCLDRSAHANNAIALKQGDFLVKANGDPPKLLPRPSADFTAALPTAYRDTLPSGYRKFKEQTVPLKNAAPFAYGDVEAWLNAEPRIRGQFVVRWRSKADNPVFRASLEHDLAKHPEWDRVLHPEKYQPPPSQAPAAHANAAAIASTAPKQ